jgi:hypothetical protein
VIWRIVSPRKIMSPEGGINFRGETIRHITRYKVDSCFITSNILHSSIIIWSSSYLTTDTKWWPIFSTPVLNFTMKYEIVTWYTIITYVWYNHATYKRPAVDRTECHVTFFRQIKFKISIWVCNNKHYYYTSYINNHK